MNITEREMFERNMSFVMKHMGDEVVRHLKPGIQYWRDLETRIGVLEGEKAVLEHEVCRLKRELAGKASTCEIKIPKGGLESYGKDPEPQTPGEGSGIAGNALIRDENKIKTETVKVGFFRRLFGG